MGLELAHKQFNYGAAGIDFDFDKPIKKYCIGFSKICYTYGNDDHHVKDLILDLGDNSVGGKRLSIKPKMVMVDNHTGGTHDLDEESYVTINVVALTGDDDDDFIMFPPVKNDSEHTAPNKSPSICEATLGGFDVSFGNDEHFRSFVASVNATYTEKIIKLSGKCKINDEGTKSGEGTTKAGLISYFGKKTDFQVVPFALNVAGDGGGSSNNVVKIDLDGSGKDCRLFIKSLDFIYKDADHHVKKLEAKLNYTLNDNQLEVKLTGNFHDDTGHDGGYTVSGFAFVTLNCTK